MSREPLTKPKLTGLLARSGGCCERCGLHVVDPDAVTMVGRGDWWSVQHRKPAGMGGTRSPLFNSPSNVALLCGTGTTGCHGEVESDRDQAYDDGWLVRQAHDPAERPILRHGKQRLLLTDDWCYAEVLGG